MTIKKQRLMTISDKLNPTMHYYMMHQRHLFESLSQKLDGLSPLKVMDKGYGLLEKNQKVITSINDVSIDDTITITLKDGILQTLIKEKKER
jgi:exodeoxyribonuclease VII large subunit